mgnify:CR=1 FL=1
MILDLLRELLGFRTYEQEFQAGAKYAQEQLQRHRGNLHEYHRLWAECEPGGIDSNGFDAGMRQVLSMRNIPHPLDFQGFDHDAKHGSNDCFCGR